MVAALLASTVLQLKKGQLEKRGCYGLPLGGPDLPHPPCPPPSEHTFPPTSFASPFMLRGTILHPVTQAGKGPPFL